MDKDLFIQIIWDIFALNLTIMLATVNSLTYIFMVASIILLIIVIKDISTYKKGKYVEKNKFIFTTLLTLISAIPLTLLILIVAKKDLNVNYVLTYTLYGLSSVLLAICLVFGINDVIKQRELKQTDMQKEEEKLDFVVKEMGTSIDRENNKTNLDKTNSNNIDDTTITNDNIVDNLNDDNSINKQ